MGVRRTYLLVLVVALCLAGVSVIARDAVAGSRGAPPHGALVPLRGAGSCFGGRRCPELGGFGVLARTSRLPAVSDLRLSGRMLLVDGRLRLAVLRRDPRTGALSQPAGGAGCLARGGAHVPGCAAFPHLGDTVLSSDGRTLWISQKRPTWLRYTRDPRTGRLQRSGTSTTCDVLLQARCPSLRGVRDINEIMRHGSRALVLGTDDGGALAVLTRTARRWVQPPGRSGCANRQGTDGCAAVGCMSATRTTAPAVITTADRGRHLYIAPDFADQEETNEGYVAAFTRTAGGGMAPVGCRLTGNGGDATGLAPILLTTLPHSDTVLVLVARGNEGDGNVFARFYTARAGADGALRKLQPLGPENELFNGDDNELNTAVVAPDRRTLYAIDDNGDLEAWRLTSTSVHRIPGRWGTPVHAASKGVEENSHGPEALLISSDGRFLYVGFSPADVGVFPNAPVVRAYRVAR